MNSADFFNEDFLEACIETMPSEMYSRVAAFAIAQQLLPKETPLPDVLYLARYLEIGKPHA